MKRTRFRRQACARHLPRPGGHPGAFHPRHSGQDPFRSDLPDDCPHQPAGEM